MKKSLVLLAGFIFISTAAPVFGQGTQVAPTSVVYPQPTTVVYPAPSVIPNQTEVISIMPSHNIVVNTGQIPTPPQYPTTSVAPAQRSDMEQMPIIVYPTPSVIPNRSEVISTTPSHNIVVPAPPVAVLPYPTVSVAPAQRSDMEQMPIVINSEQISPAQLKQLEQNPLEAKLNKLINWLKSAFSA